MKMNFFKVVSKKKKKHRAVAELHTDLSIVKDKQSQH